MFPLARAAFDEKVIVSELLEEIAGENRAE